MNESSCVFEIIYNKIQSSDNRLSVARLCSIAGVSRSGYYAWIKGKPSIMSTTNHKTPHCCRA